MAYSLTQIRLHWIVFILVALQYLLHESIIAAWDQIQKGGTPAFDPLVTGHVVGGVLILALVVWRIVLKLQRGAPALPENEPPALKAVAQVTHLGLYLLLILMAVSGGTAWFGGVEFAAEVHEVLRIVLLALVGLHVLGALYQQFVLKSDVMQRMRKPG
ncbi:cytochrome b [Thalassovita taeanensis]|uniref:Cytochrome b561 n=1 Tax=Thalassovita taeanensis TaxID=657014 RepID=A0A1H9DGD0_9RHOB|nr:cytochrome b/b6 domain-containing protein [Thalassovita taeanensis]SEQ12536.1 cytochrome b561 [Thalassovita taeanensis]